MDISFQLRRAIQTGTVRIGFRETEKSLLNGKSKLIIIASNVPEDKMLRVLHLAKVSGTPVYRYEGTSFELGELIGRPHFVSVLSVEDPGDSNILELAKEVST